jgi:hypothetical protein
VSRPNIRFGSLFLVLFGLTFLFGCAASPQFNLSVSALAAPGAEAARRYVLLPGNEGVKPGDLQFQEYAEYVHRAMALQGFEKAASEQDAQLFVVAAYSIGDPQQHTYTYSVPQWGQTGISSATTYGTANTYGTVSNYGTYSGATSYSGTTYYQPTYGVTGFSSGVGQYITYTRTLGLIAFDAASTRAGSEPKELWRVSVVSTGSSGDLRLIFPYLVTAAQPYVGKATAGKAIDVSFGESDVRVAQIRGEVTVPAQPQK